MNSVRAVTASHHTAALFGRGNALTGFRSNAFEKYYRAIVPNVFRFVNRQKYFYEKYTIISVENYYSWGCAVGAPSDFFTLGSIKKKDAPITRAKITR